MESESKLLSFYLFKRLINDAKFGLYRVKVLHRMGTKVTPSNQALSAMRLMCSNARS